MLLRVTPNKFAARVYQGDVGDDQVGMHRRELATPGIEKHDQVLVYTFEEKKPYLLRTYCYVVELKKNMHSAYSKASQGYVLLSTSTMEALTVENGDGLILDPLVSRRDLGDIMRKAREFYGN